MSSKTTQTPMAELDPCATLPAPGLEVVTTMTLPELSVAAHGSPAFRLVETLGEGGMGVVCRATQAGVGRDVAVKYLHRDASQHEHDALLTEALLMGRLEHPSIVPIYAVGVSSELGPVVVMKRVVGRSWRASLPTVNHARPETLAEHVEILIRVCDGIDFAHGQGVLHRDIKPDNVLLGDFGEVYVADWGAAFEVSTGHPPSGIVGTPAYMAPEQARAAAGTLSPATDIFLLGASLYEVLFGEPPHLRATAAEALEAAKLPLTFPETSTAPLELMAICGRACAFEPSDRFASVADMVAALRSFLRHQDAQRLVDAAVATTDALEARTLTQDNAVEVADRAADAEGLFRQALKLAPAEGRAADGAERCRRIQVAAAIARRSLEEAERLAAELVDLPSCLSEELEALRRDRSAQREAHRQQDLRVGAAHRRRTMLVLLAVIGAVVAGGLILRPGESLPTMASTASLMSVVFVAWLVLLWRGRQRFFGTRSNRMFALGCSSVLFALFIGRWIGVAIAMEPAAGAFAELIVFMMAAIQMSPLHPGFWINFAIAAAGVVALLVAPSQVRWIMTGAILSQPVVAWAVWRDLPDAEGGPDGETHSAR